MFMFPKIKLVKGWHKSIRGAFNRDYHPIGHSLWHGEVDITPRGVSFYIQWELDVKDGSADWY